MSKLSLATSAIACWALVCIPVQARQQDRQPVPHIIRKSGGVLQASATTRVEPVYPPLAKAAGVSGLVVVEVTIDETGNVIAASAISGHPLLKDAAVQGARAWKFQPTKLSGTPVKVIGTLTFNFVLESKPALEDAEKKVQKQPGSAQARYDLATAYFQAGRIPDAIQSLRDARDAVLIDPKFESAYRELGLYLGAARGQEGKLEKALEVDSQRPDHLPMPARLNAHLQLGGLYEKLGRDSDAVATLKEAVSLYPQGIDARLALGKAYLRLGNTKSAMDQYDALKPIDADSAAALLKEIDKQNDKDNQGR